MVRIVSAANQEEIRQIMEDIGVDPYGIKIMLPKAASYLVKMASLSNAQANILKQGMLSLGADAAVARGVLTGQAKTTDCLLMASLSQILQLKQKLNQQPFGLDKIAEDLPCALRNYQRERFTVDLGRYKLNLGRRVYIMGILNRTPDSFSGDGLYPSSSEEIINFAEKMIKEGADIIDVGGESSRPGARPVSVKEELSRIIPAVKILEKRIKVPISIDTYKPEVARQALDNGAVIVNDIAGLRDIRMARIIAKYKAGVVIMHMKGKPLDMQKNPQYDCLIEEIINFLETALIKAEACGINKERIIIDPGIGFGKTLEHNLEILKRLREFKVLGRPILAGSSRKSFIGKILNTGPQERLPGTIASCVLAVQNGASIVRVHDVKEVKQALKVADSILNC